MAKLDIDFILIDESVVMNGFRCLMAGAKLEAFKANPVLLYMHKRDKDNNECFLPIGKWYDIRIEGNKLLAKPDFDDEDEFAVKVQGKVKGGYLNAASIWLEPLAASNDEKLKLANQTGATITSWGVLEASIVDIPNCKNALAIRNSKGDLLKLTADSEIFIALNNLSNNNKENNMSFLKLAAQKIGMPETSTEDEVNNKLAVLVANAAKAEAYKLAAETAKTDLANYKAKAKETEINNLVDGAIASQKILASQKDAYLKLAAADFDGLKSIIETMPAYKSIESQVGGNEDTKLAAETVNSFMKKTGEELWKSGELEELKKLSIPHFKLKYKEAFGTEFTDTKN